MELPKALQVLYHSVIVVSRSALLWGLRAFITRNIYNRSESCTVKSHVKETPSYRIRHYLSVQKSRPRQG
ncbi:unnamed protein product [Citrullus colocynthis]|uniref:Secreted protein n=1 Tax=Citrullus colocynthis TaxID=252529 RepID=A0ABP0YAC5_9ROSI